MIGSLSYFTRNSIRKRTMMMTMMIKLKKKRKRMMMMFSNPSFRYLGCKRWECSMAARYLVNQ